MSVAVTGIGWINGRGFAGGRSGSMYTPCNRQLPKIKGRDLFNRPNKHFGRLDDFSKAGFAAIYLAVRDAGMLQENEVKQPIGIMAETAFGSIWTDQAYFETVVPEQGKFASPNLFAYTLSSCFLGEASIFHRFTGDSVVVNTETVSGLHALRIALAVLESGECSHMLAGYNQVVVTPLDTGDGNPVQGSLFIMLEKNASSDNVYCDLLWEKNAVCPVFENKPITDLDALVALCLNSKVDKKE